MSRIYDTKQFGNQCELEQQGQLLSVVNPRHPRRAQWWAQSSGECSAPTCRVCLAIGKCRQICRVLQLQREDLKAISFSLRTGKYIIQFFAEAQIENLFNILIIKKSS